MEIPCTFCFIDWKKVSATKCAIKCYIFNALGYDDTGYIIAIPFGHLLNASFKQVPGRNCSEWHKLRNVHSQTHSQIVLVIIKHQRTLLTVPVISGPHNLCWNPKLSLCHRSNQILLSSWTIQLELLINLQFEPVCFA